MSENETLFAVRCKLRPFESQEELVSVLLPHFPDMVVEDDYIYQDTRHREIVQKRSPLSLIYQGRDDLWVDWVIAYEYSCDGITCAPGYDNTHGVSLEELNRIDWEFTQRFGDHREPGVYVVAYTWYNGCEPPEAGVPTVTAKRRIDMLMTKHKTVLTGTEDTVTVRCINPEHLDVNPSMEIDVCLSSPRFGEFKCVSCDLHGNFSNLSMFDELSLQAKGKLLAIKPDAKLGEIDFNETSPKLRGQSNLTMIDEAAFASQRWYHVSYTCAHAAGTLMSEIVYKTTANIVSLMNIKESISARLAENDIDVAPEQIALLSWTRISDKGELLD